MQQRLYDNEQRPKRAKLEQPELSAAEHAKPIAKVSQPVVSMHVHVHSHFCFLLLSFDQALQQAWATMSQSQRGKLQTSNENVMPPFIMEFFTSILTTLDQPRATDARQKRQRRANSKGTRDAPDLQMKSEAKRAKRIKDASLLLSSLLMSWTAPSCNPAPLRVIDQLAGRRDATSVRQLRKLLDAFGVTTTQMQHSRRREKKTKESAVASDLLTRSDVVPRVFRIALMDNNDKQQATYSKNNIFDKEKRGVHLNSMGILEIIFPVDADM